MIELCEFIFAILCLAGAFLMLVLAVIAGLTIWYNNMGE